MADTNGAVTVLPAEVTLDVVEAMSPRFTPRELRAIKDQLGRSFSEVIADDDGDEKYVVLAWLKLRRDGYDITLADMDDVVVSLSNSAVDPTTVLRDTISQRSAATGE